MMSDTMMKKLIQPSMPSAPVAGGLFFRMKVGTGTFFMKSQSIEKKAEKLISDADSLIAKASDYHAARPMYARAAVMLLVADARNTISNEISEPLLSKAYAGLPIYKKEKGERLGLLLAKAHIGRAFCRKENGEEFEKDAKKAYEYSAKLLVGSSIHNDAWNVHFQAEKLLNKK
jgi:hypothetical protein